MNASDVLAAPLRVVFWHDYLMFHQAPYIKALADQPGVEVDWVVREELSDAFRRRGYPVPETGRVRVHVSPTEQDIKKIFAEGPRAFHVFFGLRNMALAQQAFEISKTYDVTRILMSENRYEPGWRLLPRRLAYAMDARKHARWLKALLCIGYSGRFGGQRFFASCGWKPRDILPFLHHADPGDSTQPLTTAARAEDARQAPAKLLFVGQLIHRKGIDLLFRALKQLPHASWQLTIIGTGELGGELAAQVRQLSIEDQVAFLGNMDNASVLQHLLESTMLVLPSRFDGWGAVVSEALQCGTPVVCSERCGAADLLLDDTRGYVFRAGDVADLATGIRHVMCSGAIQSRHDMQRWAECIRGPAAARYFLEVLRYVDAPRREMGPPLCPWMPSHAQQSF